MLQCTQVALIGMLAYLSYLCGELLGISGIVSLFCCGVIISHYVRRSQSMSTHVEAYQYLNESVYEPHVPWRHLRS